MPSAEQFNRQELARERQLGELIAMVELDKQKAVNLLNRILEAELAGVVRYTHYSFLVFGHNRIRLCRGCGNRRPSRSPMPSRPAR